MNQLGSNRRASNNPMWPRRKVSTNDVVASGFSSVVSGYSSVVSGCSSNAGGGRKMTLSTVKDLGKFVAE